MTPPVAQAPGSPQRLPGSFDPSNPDGPSLTVPTTSSSYVLRTDDAIRIDIYQEPDMAVSQLIDQQGQVMLPLLDEVDLAGKTVREAEAHLEQRYIGEEILIDPHVTVTVIAYAQKTIQVIGEVRAPGIKVLPRDATSLDILEVIAMAGYFTDIANQDRIKVLRLNDTGEQTTLFMDVEDLLKGRKPRTLDDMRDYRIYAGDTVVVADRWF